MFLCICKGVRARDVERLGQAGVVEPEALTAALELDDDGCCGRCADNIDEFVDVAQDAWACALPKSA